MRVSFPLLPLLIAFFCASSTPILSSPAQAGPPPVPSVSGTEPGSDVIASTFGLTPPVRIGFCEEHPQDGTLGVTLVDRSGKAFPCGLEVGSTAGIDRSRQPASRPRRVFVGATSSMLPNARLLPLWGTEERALIRLLTVAIADSISDAQNDLLMKGARSGVLADPGGFGLLRLVGSVERRRRMLAAISAGETAPLADAAAYFGLSGTLTVMRIDLDGGDRLGAITIADAAGRQLMATPRRPDGGTREDAWLLDVGGSANRLYVPLGGYEERYLLTVLSAALRASDGRAPAEARAVRARGAAPDSSALKAAARTIEYRKSRIREQDRFS